MWGNGVAQMSSVFAPCGDGEMRADELGASPVGWPARLAHGARGSGGRYCSRDSKGGGVGLGTCGMDAWQRHTQRRGRQQSVHARRRAARVLQGGAGGRCTHRAVFVACGAERAGVSHAQARWAHERRMPRWRSPGHAGKWRCVLSAQKFGVGNKVGPSPPTSWLPTPRQQREARTHRTD